MATRRKGGPGWKNPLDAFKEPHRPETATERLDKIIQATARPVVPVPGETPRNALRVPSDFRFSALTVPTNSTLTVRESQSPTFDTFVCDFIETFLTWDEASTLIVLADDVEVALLRAGLRLTVPGTKSWKIRNSSLTTAFNVTGVLLSAVEYDWRPPYVLAKNDAGELRSLRVTGDENALIVSMSPDNELSHNSEMYRYAFDTQQGYGFATGKNVTLNNANVLAGVAGSTWIVTDVYLQWADNVPALGDIITASFHFATESEFWRLEINTLAPAGVGGGGHSVAHHFGVTGPRAGVAGRAIQVDIAHPLAGTADGWRAGARARRFVGV